MNYISLLKSLNPFIITSEAKQSTPKRIATPPAGARNDGAGFCSFRNYGCWQRLATLSFVLFFMSVSQVLALSVKDVKVSVTANSSAKAREKALEQAHALAFEKVVAENFPDQEIPLPSPDKLMNMVTNFSIDKEKTSSKSYAASLTFQFDGGQVQSWIQKSKVASTEPLSSSPAPTSSKQEDESNASVNISQAPMQSQSGPLKLTINYTSLPEWHHIKRTLEETQGMVKVDVLKLSAQSALLDIQYGGDMEKLQQDLEDQGLLLSLGGDGWAVASNKDTR